MSGEFWQCHYVVFRGNSSRACARPADPGARFCGPHLGMVLAYVDELRERQRSRRIPPNVMLLMARLRDAEARARTPEPSVYYVQQGADGLIKIGYSVHPTARLSSLGPRANELRLLATEPGGSAVEQMRHKQFAGLRETGEWFRPGIALLRHVKSIEAAQEPLELLPAVGGELVVGDAS